MPCKHPKPADCSIPDAKGCIRPEGTGANRVLMLGEGPGDHEAWDGLPFRPGAPAGSVLERAIREAGFGRSSFRLFNMIQCQPPQNWLDGAPWEADAIEHCRPVLDAVVKGMNPKCILTLGNVPTRHLTGLSGPKLNIGNLRGYVLLSSQYPGCPVLPTFHPSYLRRGGKSRTSEGAKVKGDAGGGMALLGVLIADIKKAVEVAARGLQSTLPYDPGYCLFPSPDDAHSFLHRVSDNCNLPLAYDIETDYSEVEDEEQTDESYGSGAVGADNIRSIQFSLARGTAIYFPWIEPYIAIALRILALPNPKYNFNGWRFDDPLLRSKGAVINGLGHDFRWTWHHLEPDLPAGLQFVASFFGWLFPWKHLSAGRPELYGCFDVDVLHHIGADIFNRLRSEGILRGYEQHVLRLEPILLDMSARGMPVSAESHAALRERLEAEHAGMEAAFQEAVPDECKPFTPKLGYKSEANWQRAVKRGGNFALHKFTVEVEHKTHSRSLECDVTTIGTEEVERWVKLGLWKPSIKGLSAYIRAKGWEVPRNFKTGKDTTGALELKRLADKTKDPLLRNVLRYRDIGVLVNNLLPNWQPGPDGRVHTSFYYDPATGQLSTRRPNIQNAIKHGETSDKKALADAFRAMVVADSGHTLLEFDYKSFHALTLGFEARDPDYMRLARLDIHSFLAARLTRSFELDYLLALSDGDLRERLKWVKANYGYIRDKKAKPTILGYGFGLGPRSLYHYNIESIESEREARTLIASLDAAFPRTAAYRRNIRQEAHLRKRLLTRHGYHRRFYEVFRFNWWDGSYDKPGDDAEAVIALRPANDAFGHKKDVMLRLEEQGALARFGFINEIHDAFLFHCPLHLKEECISIVKAEMERPSEVLVDPDVAPGGLWCEVGVKEGNSWEAMK